jgi:glycosyltransferase A (GT-A) superfamily protein (DUF2064 family)
MIGSDIPYLTTEILGRAVDLVADKPVIGPTDTQGFYLLGLPPRLLTKNISFTEVLKLSDQCAGIEKLLGEPLLPLSKLSDIDHPQDVAKLTQWLREGVAAGRKDLPRAVSELLLSS